MGSAGQAMRTRFPSPLVGEGGSRGAKASASRVRGLDSREAITPHPPRSLRSLGILSHKGRGLRKESLPRLHHLFRLPADAGDAFDLERRAAGFLRDLAVVLDDEAERGRVLLQAAQELGRHAPVGALRAVLVDDVEEHEFAFGIGTRFLGHGRCPIGIPSFRGRPQAATRNDEPCDSHPVTKKKNPAQARGFSSRLASDRLQIGSGRLAVLAIGFDVERELLALVEIAHAGALDCRDVNEHIRPAAVLHDEAEALLGVEELNGTCGHSGLLWKTHLCVYAPRKPFAWASYPDFCEFLGEGPLGPKLQVRLNLECRLYRVALPVWQSLLRETQASRSGR